MTDRVAAGRVARFRRRLESSGRWQAAAWITGAAVVLLVIAVLEGDLPEELGEVTALVNQLLRRFGVGSSLLLLYVEESGVPLPVPGDVYVIYLGHLATGSATRWVEYWLAIIAVVVAGASNLYLLARRFGRGLLVGRLGVALHLTTERLDAAERAFARWGALAIIFGRHVPGFRIPVTIVAGTLRVPYRIFAPSVAVSSAIWAGAWLWLGDRLSGTISALLSANRWLLPLVVVLLAVAVAYLALRLIRTPGPSI